MSAAVRGALTLLAATLATGLVGAGCSSSSGNNATVEDGGSDGTSGSSDSSTDSSSSEAGSSSGGDSGGCVFETLVTGLVTSPPPTPITCSTPLCGCTDDGKLIPSVKGYF
jgi:hypothetical protein